MMRKKVIGFHDQEYILNICANIADDMPQYSNDLRNAGYLSYQAWAEFEELFCEGLEIIQHNICVIDRAKQRISSPDGLLRRGEVKGPQAAYDPCAARLSRMEREVGDYVSKCREKMFQRFFDYREEECRNLKYHSLEISRDFQESTKYGDIFKNILIKCFDGLGFNFDPVRSRNNFPVLSKPITKG